MRDLETWDTQTGTDEYWGDSSLDTVDVDEAAITDTETGTESDGDLDEVSITAPPDWDGTEYIEAIPASEHARKLGARLTARAATFGVTLPKGMADRAGQVMAGEPVTAPLDAPETFEDQPADDQPAIEPERDAIAETVVLRDGTAEEDHPDPAAEAPETKEEVSQAPEAVKSSAVEADDGDIRLRVGPRLGVLWAENGTSMQELSEASGVEPKDLVDLFNNGHPDVPKVLIPVMQALGVEPTTGLQMINGYLDEISRQQADEK